MLVDSHLRKIRKLRVSLTDMCNFRCFYCMPKNVKFTPKSQLLSAEEIGQICGALVEHGLTQIRVTGGEPTLRADFDEIMTRLSQLPIEKIAVTSNGFYLEGHLQHLYSIGCRHLNISLDSLSKEKFNQITNSKGFERVYNAILAAKEMGFHVKVNVLLLKGVNDEELIDFVEFSSKTDIEVRFLEMIKIGLGCKYHDLHFISAGEALNRIQRHEHLTAVEDDFDSTSFSFMTASGAKIGFIASETKPFCASCSRLRLTATGALRACLMSDKGVNLRGISVEEYPSLLRKVIEMKPMDRVENCSQNIYQIGG